MKATHNGHCQVCGRIQAVRPLLAKHGYTVELGFFNGTCSGAGAQPVEESTAILDATVADLTARAEKLNALTLDQIDTVQISEYRRDANRGRGGRIPRSFNREEWDAYTAPDGEGPSQGYRRSYTFEYMQERELARRQGVARQMLAHCEGLERLKADRAGQPLLERKP